MAIAGTAEDLEEMNRLIAPKKGRITPKGTLTKAYIDINLIKCTEMD